MVENNGIKNFIFSPELLERSTPRKYRRRSLMFRYRLRVFCSLHRPVSFKSRLYHYILITIMLFSCVVVNVFDVYFGNMAFILMSITDLFLTAILTIELFARLWSSECLTDYSGLLGKLVYARDYGILRALDILGIITFIYFISLQELNEMTAIILRLLHVFQVFQIYRIMLPILKLMTNTVLVQWFQLYVALISLSLIITVMAFSVYLKEMESIKLADSFWFTYISLATIGYGDVVPQTTWGKVFTCLLAFFGISAFQLPANIFGTGLAIKLRDNQKKVMFQNPAANLIQTFWKCYATDRESKQTSVWKLFKKNRTISETDKQCIRFVLKFRYFRARRQFKGMTDPKRFGNESEEQLDLLRKLSLIENTLLELKNEIYDLKNDYDSLINELEELVKNSDSN